MGRSGVVRPLLGPLRLLSDLIACAGSPAIPMMPRFAGPGRQAGRQASVSRILRRQEMRGKSDFLWRWGNWCWKTEGGAGMRDRFGGAPPLSYWVLAESPSAMRETLAEACGRESCLDTCHQFPQRAEVPGGLFCMSTMFEGCLAQVHGASFCFVFLGQMGCGEGSGACTCTMSCPP